MPLVLMSTRIELVIGRNLLPLWLLGDEFSLHHRGYR